MLCEKKAQTQGHQWLITLRREGRDSNLHVGPFIVQILMPGNKMLKLGYRAYKAFNLAQE